MNAVIEKIPALVGQELEAANCLHTVFHTPHEGYAVLLEEIEETRDELLDLLAYTKSLWDAVKLDNHADGRNYARMIEEKAARLAAEAIQAAAMARKFQALEPGQWGGRNG